MFGNVAKIGLIVTTLVLTVEDAKALGHPRGSSAGCGGWYAGTCRAFTFDEFGGPGGWGAPGCGYTGGQLNWCGCPANSTKYVSNCMQTASDGAMLTVSVPADARVFVNGRATTSTGGIRQFASGGLEKGAAYRYQVRVEFVRDGNPVSEEKTVSITAGHSDSLSFIATPETQMAEKATFIRR